MELRHLRYFVAVAEELHFGRAADRLFMAQPPLSQQIKQLEAEVGVLLFSRTNRKVELTDAGKSFFEDVKKIFAEIEDAKQRAVWASRGESGILRVAFVGSLSYDIFPSILRKFRDEYPNVELVLTETLGYAQIEAIKSGRIHVGFSRLPSPAKGIRNEVIAREPLVAAVSSDSPLAKLETIDLYEVVQEPFIQFPQSFESGYARLVHRLVEDAGGALNIVQKVDEVETAISLVAAGLGISIVPGVLQNLQRTGVSYVPFKSPPPMVDLTMSYRENDSSPVLPRFLEIARQARKIETF